MKTKQRILWRLGCVAHVVYCLLIWSLEAVAAPTFTVNSSSDVVDANPGDGVCEIAPGNGVCTLRAAIMEANHTPGGGATIILPAGTYILTIPGSCCLETNGDLNITRSMTIVGAGASNTIIDGNGSVTQDGVLFISGGLFVDISVDITGVTVRNGQNGFGGGVANLGGALTISNSTISGNSAPGDCDFTGAGGGIRNDGFGTLTIINSTVSGNSAGCEGGGIANFQESTLTIINSTVSGNSGGGVFNIGALTIINSTVSGNSGPGIANFPGISNKVGATQVFNSTITQNSLGVLNFFAFAPFTFQNSILAGNFNQCEGTFTSNGFNLMESFDASRCTINGAGVTLADPKLGPLQNNGGPTQTHALLAGSPAIDGGAPYDRPAGFCPARRWQ